MSTHLGSSNGEFGRGPNQGTSIHQPCPGFGVPFSFPHLLTGSRIFTKTRRWIVLMIRFFERLHTCSLRSGARDHSGDCCSLMQRCCFTWHLQALACSFALGPLGVSTCLLRSLTASQPPVLGPCWWPLNN